MIRCISLLLLVSLLMISCGQSKNEKETNGKDLKKEYNQAAEDKRVELREEVKQFRSALEKSIETFEKELDSNK